MLNHKRRIVSRYTDISLDKLSYKELVYNGNFAGTIQLNMIHTITVEEINEYLRTVIEIPTILSTDVGWRWLISQRTSYYMKHNSDSIDKEVKEILGQYFDWLKERKDYVESPEDKEVRIIKERNIARAKLIRGELIETLYHPDHYEKMYAIYGEIWADIHLPY
jgi:hypothetical protein